MNNEWWMTNTAEYAGESADEYAGASANEYIGEFADEFANQEWEEEANRRRRLPRRAAHPRAGVRGRRRPHPWLVRGQGSGEYVRWVQSTLNQILDLRLPVDGTMGPAVRSALRSFQKKQGLPPDGTVGPDTERALLAARGGQAAAKRTDQPPDATAKSADQEPASEPAAKNGDQPPASDPPETEYGWQEWESWQGESGPQRNSAQRNNTHDLTPRQELRSKIAEIATEEWRQRWSKGALKECEPRGRAILEEYWQRGVGRIPNQPNYCDELPWSAVFISWVIRKASAGTPFKDAFHYSNRPTDFVGAAKKNKLEDNKNPFKAYPISEKAPRVGDLVCSGITYANVDKENRPPHCDIVTEVLRGEIKVIGGNRRQSVVQRSIKIDHNGYIKEPEYYAVVLIEA
ncbi:MAG: DUF2272 domain-containing protein [Caldilinea sp. CFX5]|nr:DUF2272 domain-containing protein [Caldilinea sp. CFX5]